MHRVIFAPDAEAQLVALYFQLAAAASPEIADRYTEAIVEQCEKLNTFPLRGTLRDDIRQGLRTFGFRRRVTIAFEVSVGTVTILGVFYGGQDLAATFEG
ncbi:MAG: type II toxin-antitoxin system RelE/ParE family toxin [Terracidiphilus sp.]|jgi:toxin ParE1/3/4